MLALLVKDRADPGVKPGAASVLRRRQVRAIANTGNERESIFIKRYARRDEAAVCLTGPSRNVKGLERGVQTGNPGRRIPCTYGSLDSPSVDVDSLPPTASPLPHVPF